MGTPKSNLPKRHFASKGFVGLAGLAADAGKTASRGLILGAQVDGAAVRAGGLGLRRGVHRRAPG
jgi:hypothetical protein